MPPDTTEPHKHAHWMDKALDLARNGLCSTRPNPRVGCILVAENSTVVGEGWHQAAGEPHAERLALKQAGTAARGATAYITLEPCDHNGRTPPCSTALIDSGIRRVVIAMQDPDPRVCGSGIDRLRSAGIEVVLDVLQDAAAELNPGFIRRMRDGYPWVICKLAITADSRLVTPPDSLRWITGPESRAEVHLLRQRCCALLTGIGTVWEDNPRLTARDNIDGSGDQSLAAYQPLRVVADTHFRLPEAAAMVQDPWPIVVAGGATTPPEWMQRLSPAKLASRQFPAAEAEGVDLKALLAWLANDRQCNELLLEAGPRLSAAMLRADLIDEFHLYMATPKPVDGMVQWSWYGCAKQCLSDLAGDLNLQFDRGVLPSAIAVATRRRGAAAGDYCLAFGGEQRFGYDWRLIARPVPMAAERG